MNKRGFTLVELLVSISLLSVVLVFMMSTLVKLRDTDIASGVETNLLVGQALITKTISLDILEWGIDNYESCTNDSVIINLKGYQNSRTLELNKNVHNIEDSTILTYRSGSKSLLIRKAPKGFYYKGIQCETIEGEIIRITIKIQDKDGNELPDYKSEILYHKK